MMTNFLENLRLMFSRDLLKGLALPLGYLSQLLQIFSNNVSPNLLWFGVAASKTIFFVTLVQSSVT